MSEASKDNTLKVQIKDDQTVNQLKLMIYRKYDELKPFQFDLFFEDNKELQGSMKIKDCLK